MTILKNKIYFSLLIILIIYSCNNALNIGLSWDELFHYLNGKVRFNYLTSLGQNKEYNFSNNIYYPGFYDTLTYSLINLIKLIAPNFFKDYFDQIIHIINLLFSILSIYGLYSLVKLFLNKETAIISSLFTFINPFFFGHSAINPKDIIIFFSLVWFLYFLLKFLKKFKNKHLILMSFFAGIGCGIRLSFIGIIIPIFILTFIYLLKQKKKFRIKDYISYISIILIIINFIILSTWPHVIDGGIKIYFDTIINSFNWSDVPFYGFINGEIYEIKNTPLDYFLKFMVYRMPFYSTFLLILGFILSIIYKEKLIDIYGNQIKTKIILILFIIIFPIFLAILLRVNLYDNIRLFIFILPFISIINAIFFIILIKLIRTKNFIKINFLIFLFLFSIFIYRFISLSPFQYSYINYTFINLENTNGKFEHDYWNTSFKHLVSKLEDKYTIDELKRMKFSWCGGNANVLAFYLNKKYKITKLFSPKSADYILMTNRGLFKKTVNEKTCFEKYKGKNIIEINKNGMILSVLRKINT